MPGINISAIPVINSASRTFISNSDKGVIAADRILDQAIRAYCCQHISENVKKEFGIGAKDLFWKLARSHSMSEFQQHHHEFSTAKPNSYILYYWYWL